MLKRDYIETVSGRKIFLPDCDPTSIDIEDIAHALSLACRFAGHVPYHYSVAEHSIWVASLCSPTNQKQGLLHDGTEAYLCDIPTPFKRMMPEYKALEDDLALAISIRFDLPETLHDEVKMADRIMLMTERDYLKGAAGDPWQDEYENTPRVPNWRPLRMNGAKKRATPNYVKGLFLERFAQYSA